MKRVSKPETERTVRDADTLEIIVDQISRNDTTSTKLMLLNRFSTEVKKLIKEERDILLIALKLK